MPHNVHDTFVLVRRYPKPPRTVFAALADPAKKRRWLTDGKSHDVEAFESDFRVGGAERARYRMNAATPFPGALLTSDGIHFDIVPDSRVVIASSMAMDGRVFSVALCTFALAPSADGGSELTFTHQGAFFEGADGPQMRRQGWSDLLDRLGVAA
ncbi:MAG TPA: SRPBCC domain-containing protein [Rhizomicrobium sp.]